jgi:hypothetical protein
VNREKLFEESKWKLEHGEAPTEEAIKEYQREERKKQQQLENTIRREEELQKTQTIGNVLKSTAEPRPTAYIPDDLGIPKPYGQSAPFKPSELGSSMRHIRLPNPKPIEL